MECFLAKEGSKQAFYLLMHDRLLITPSEVSRSTLEVGKYLLPARYISTCTRHYGIGKY